MDGGVSIIDAEIAGATDGWRLDRALTEALPNLSRERVKALISSGLVLGIDGVAVRDPARKAIAGQRFSINAPKPAPEPNEAHANALGVVVEDEHLIVIDKPARLVVSPDTGKLQATLVNALRLHSTGQFTGGSARRRAGRESVGTFNS